MKWEYKTVPVKDLDSYRDVLASWEMVSVDGGVAYFKRSQSVIGIGVSQTETHEERAARKAADAAAKRSA